MSSDIQEAIRRSLETEKNAMLFYQYGARQFKDAAAKKTFELLSREEREHAGHFYRIYKGGDIPSLDAFLDSAPENEASWIASSKKLCGEDMTEKMAMEIAMDKEKQLEKALSDVAVRMTDPEVRAVYDLNVKETHNHYLVIEAEYSRIMRMVDESDMDTFVRE
ncbi:MAG: ferritin family protein [Geobacteraceae bacterium]|nr:ferritin family protein [Geobacteraceae bacterium]